MNRYRIFFWTLVVLVFNALTSCSKDDDPQAAASDLPMGAAYITDSTYYSDKSMTVYNFAYPSTDPYGNPVMLSGTISFGDGVKNAHYAKGMLLYNHFTVYRADQCPSKGSLMEQGYTAMLSLITVSPDYYGFGSTEHHHQAYCLSQTNAQASVDALLAAKEIMASQGYTWGDMLFNAGYSQGGQTTMGVVRLVAEKYPDINITYSLAGAGSYDLPETYRQFITATISGMPSTVISVMLSYNEFKSLGIAREEMFTEPVLSHIDDWIFSKRYTRQEIDAMVGSLSLSQYATATVLDTNSDLSHNIMAALDLDNICKGWSPRGNEKLMLFHSTKDITVPVANTQNMYDFLISNNVPAANIDLQIQDIEGNADTPAHEKAAETFVTRALFKVMEILNTPTDQANKVIEMIKNKK